MYMLLGDQTLNALCKMVALVHQSKLVNKADRESAQLNMVDSVFILASCSMLNRQCCISG